MAKPEEQAICLHMKIFLQLQQHICDNAAMVLVWDVFCKVIDNYGDVGVCWRLTRQLLARGQRVRLYLDTPDLLDWMADPLPLQNPGLTLCTWAQAESTVASATVGDVVIEAFGCELPQAFQARIAAQAAQSRIRAAAAPVWINLEYLSAEPFVARCHGLPSPIHHGPAQGLQKWFFYPGFVAQSGGLLRTESTQAVSDKAAFLQKLGVRWHGERLILLFCYAPVVLGRALCKLAADQTTLFLVAFGHSSQAVQSTLAKSKAPANARFAFLPAVPQSTFDALLWLCDINFVRGEDSLVQALWADKPMVWQIYPQSDGAHVPKLKAFLEVVQANANTCAWHWWWNGLAAEPQNSAPGVVSTRRLRQQADLCSQLLAFAAQKRVESYCTADNRLQLKQN